MTTKKPKFTREDLERAYLFRSVALDGIEPLLRDCESRVLEPGEVLIAAGQPNRYLYLLLAGRLNVHLMSTQNDPITVLEEGETAGEVSLVDHKPASAYVIAKTKSTVLILDEDLTWKLADSSHAVSRNLLRILSYRLRFDNDLIYRDRELLKEYELLATTDAITGLYNRHWLDKMLPRQMERSKSSNEPLSMLMVDIDQFKQFNDLHGHVAGDRALFTVARSLRDNIRPADMPARYAGDELTVLLPNSTVESSAAIGERLCRTTRETPIAFPHGPELPSVTVSVGVAQMKSDQSPEKFLTATDEALYRAKRAGRDRVSH